MRHLAQDIAEFLPRGPFRCRCGATIDHLGICKGCANALLREEVAERRSERLRRAIPPIHRWATIAKVIAAGHVTRHHASKARDWLDAHLLAAPSPRTLLIRGDTHVNKSALACAVLAEEIALDRDAMFLGAHEFGPDVSMEDRERAFHWGRRPELVCIDDLASVLGGAPAGSDIASRRAAGLLSVIRDRHNRRLRTIYTTALHNRATKQRPEPGICELFGEDIMARMTDPKEALVLNIERKT